MVMAAEKLMTAEELLRMPDRGRRYELVRGVLREMAPAGMLHGRIAMRLGSLLDRHVRANDLGVVLAAETGFQIDSDPDTVRAPDVSFVARQRVLEEGVPAGYGPSAPDLAVEVVSPGDAALEVEEKVGEWLAAGTRVVWVVYPRTETVAVYRSLRDVAVLTAGETLDGGDVIPGFACRVSEIFE